MSDMAFHVRLGWHTVIRKLRTALQDKTRKPDQEWVRILGLIRHHPLEEVERAALAALAAGTPRYESVRLLLRGEGTAGEVAPVRLDRVRG